MVENPETTDEAPLNTDAEVSEAESAKEPRKGLSFPVFLLIVVVASLGFRSFAFSLYNIPSESMLPGLMNGDYLAASKWNYGFSNYSLPFGTQSFNGRVFASEPERGDVVIFKHPVDGTDYIKRVIGLPGDIVEMRGGRLILNGEMVAQERVADWLVPVSANTDCPSVVSIVRREDGASYCRYPRYRETLPSGKSYNVFDLGMSPQDFWGPKVVPEGAVFLMGDNRDNSQDSRFPPEKDGGVGWVPQSLLVGKAQMILWSTDGSSEWIKPWTWFTAARGGRMGDAI